MWIGRFAFFSVGGEFGWSAKKTTSYLQTLIPANQRTSDAADHRALLLKAETARRIRGSFDNTGTRARRRTRASERGREREEWILRPHVYERRAGAARLCC